MGVKMIGKRGMSPLAATIILLALAIGLGILVMNWGRASLEQSSRCSVELGVGIIEVDGEPQICIGGDGENGYITFLLENGLIVDVSQIQFRAIGTKSIYTSDLSDSMMLRGGAIDLTIPYNHELFGEPKQFKLTPKIELFPGERISCPDQAIVIEKIRRC